jgi:hypothetical protein
MKYLDKAPFSGRANTPEFNKGYTRVKWDKPTKPKKRPKFLCMHGRFTCKACNWVGGFRG